MSWQEGRGLKQEVGVRVKAAVGSSSGSGPDSSLEGCCPEASPLS